MYLGVLLVVLLSVVSVSAQHVHYVLPNGSSPLNCPAQPCLALDRYTQQTGAYFTTGATFLFLAGNHSLQHVITLTNISDVTLRGEGTGSQVNIIWDINVTIQCHSIRNLTFEKLMFIFSVNFTRDKSESRALIINLSVNVRISNSMFQALYGNSGGAIALLESSVEILNCTFKNIPVSGSRFTGERVPYGGVIEAHDSTLLLTGSKFDGNRAAGDGGAIRVHNTTLTVSRSIFDGNTAYSGGAITADNTTLTVSGSTFDGNTASLNGGAIAADNVAFNVSWSTFDKNTAFQYGGAINARNAIFSVSGSRFHGSTAVRGGSIYAGNASLTVGGSIFDGNRVIFVGGAIFAYNATLTVSGSTFDGNEASEDGGAIGICKMSQLDLEEALGNVFAHNSAKRGGAIACNSHSTITMTKSCKIDSHYSGYSLTPCWTHLYNNTASAGGILPGDGDGGGAIFIHNCEVTLEGQLLFTNNTAKGPGGAITITLVGEIRIDITGAIFVNNSGKCGGAVYIKTVQKLLLYDITLEDITAVGNTGSAVCVYDASIEFIRSNFTGNTGRLGGGIYADNSHIELGRHCCVANNRAYNGGGIYSFGGYLSLYGHTIFSHNTADGNGGALHATYTNIALYNEVNFTSNTAQNGGAMFISTTSLTLHWTTLTTSHNHASLYGGAIYHEDKPNSEICSYQGRSISKKFPKCFLAIESVSIITSYHDSADRDGSFLYGGLLGKCRLSVYGKYNYTPYDFLITSSIFNITSNKNKKNEITAMPYTLRFCDDPLHYYKNVSISRGQRLTVSVQIFEAIGITPGHQVTALPGINARVRLNQVIKTLSSSNCTDLTYNFYSSQDQDELRLTSRGSCGDTNTAQLLIRVTLLPCPHPFVQEDEECVCDKRLLEYSNVNCTTDEYNSYVSKRHGTDFWMSILYNINGSYEGLILYKTCPPQYCKTQTVSVSMDDLDSQCDDNRGGVLCGQCLANYSLMLGSSTCTHCSHQHLALLLPFAAAGIALVVFLSFFRLTVATGMINGVILYANILQANRNAIFPANERNILTVFIAWMNLDLGFETCLYNGMTAYAQTWLQFAFPLYVWLLISLMILSSRYSITVSKLIGHNPIAVLATLLLMSYTKLLKIIIEVYSSVDLAYPDDQTVTVWLKDANVPYLQSWHLLLTVVTTLVLVLFFFPYTLLLLLGYKLYRFAGRRYFHWVHRIRPLLESYYAPYNIHTRYWTGFLLLVRCVLYIISSTYSLGNTNNSLLAIISTFTGLFLFLLVISTCFSHQLYTKAHNNIIEFSTYLNLIVLYAATGLVGTNPALVYSLVGLVFVAMLGIIVYHFHLLYIVKSQVWQQFRVKVSTPKEKLTHSATSTAAGPSVDAGKSAHVAPKMVTHTEIELREPLLQED